MHPPRPSQLPGYLGRYYTRPLYVKARLRSLVGRDGLATSFIAPCLAQQSMARAKRASIHLLVAWIPAVYPRRLAKHRNGILDSALYFAANRLSAAYGPLSLWALF
jgi:hypothetical protein